MAACLLFNFLLHTFEVACGVLHPYYFNLCVSEWTRCHILRPLWWHLQCTLLRGFQWHSRCIVGQILLLCSLQNYAVKQAVPQYRQCKKKNLHQEHKFLKGVFKNPSWVVKKNAAQKTDSASNSSAISCSRLCVAKRVYKCSAKHSLFIQWPVLGGFCKAVAAQFFCRTTSYCC